MVINVLMYSGNHLLVPRVKLVAIHSQCLGLGEETTTPVIVFQHIIQHSAEHATCLSFFPP